MNKKYLEERKQKIEMTLNIYKENIDQITQSRLNELVYKEEQIKAKMEQDNQEHQASMLNLQIKSEKNQEILDTASKLISSGDIKTALELIQKLKN